MHKQGKGFTDIATYLKCRIQSVSDVWNRYLLRGDVGSGTGRGRKRKTNKETDQAIIQDAKAEPFTSPRRIRRKLELDNISPRTVDRCSQEGGLCGRVTRHNVIIRMMK